MTSPEDAKRAVLAIAKKFGLFDDYEQVMERMGRWDPNVRRTVEESFLARDKLAAHSIKTLAKNIYGSDARFVFELLQNADDNLFTRARDVGDQPRISFHVHPRQIIIECNEDGFTKDNLRAICSVGESTKSASHGYIGAKGIGFKSVFIAAWKVDIQSGHFSFSFKHKRGDLGLGMVIPVWKDPAAPLKGPMTRMTLHLHEQGDTQVLARLRDTIFRQLSELQQTTLLFLRNLRQIGVTFYDEDSKVTSSKDFRVGPEHNNIVKLETISLHGGKSFSENKLYHRTSHIARNLARSDNRSLPGDAAAEKASSEAEVVLAFPLTSELRPLIEQQELFAFLPIRESSFKFLIQADFDTSASRQDIVATSLRNVNLRDGIADTFIKAVLQFCQHPQLCYTWPLFLPSTTVEYGVFWSGLVQRIKFLVQNTPILKSRHMGHLRMITDVSILTRDASDSDGDCLFDDSARDPFISTAYPWDSTKVLKTYGLVSCTFDILLDLLEADERSPSSRMKSPSTSQEWHSAVAQVFTKCFTMNWTHYTARLKQTVMVPLRSGNWVAADDRKTYLPATIGVPIPPGVSLDILDPAAVANTDRRTLFTHLGVTEAKVSDMRALVLRCLSNPFGHVDTDTSRAQLHYLYLTQRLRETREGPAHIMLYRDGGGIARPHNEDFYLPSDDPYGPTTLLGLNNPSSSGPRVTFLHASYLENLPDGGYAAWTSWLHEAIGVRRRLRLISRNGDALSDTVYFVLKNRPDMFLGMLEHLWKHEEQLFEANPARMTELRTIKASNLCHPTVKKNLELVLQDTYLPLPQLRQQCQELMGDDWLAFPFINVEESTNEEQLLSKWLFLHTRLRVRTSNDVRFLLDILLVLVGVHIEDIAVSVQQVIIKLYETIEARLGTSGVRTTARKAIIKNVFWERGKAAILVPPKRGREAAWTNASSCRWDAPADMVTRRPLKHLYSQVASEQQMSSLSRFFSQTLLIPSTSWMDLRDELKELKRRKCEDLDQIRDLYAHLATLKIDAFQDDLSRAFENDGLIFVVKQGVAGWYRISECLWSSTTDIRGKVTLNDDYEDMEALFVDKLGVKTLTLQMVYDELLQTGQQAPIEDVKTALWSLNALLQTEHEYPDPEPLSEKPVFPVRYASGQTALRTARTDFALNDNDSLAERFQGHIQFLDFRREEILRLRPLLRWAGLANRYLSSIVRESTSTARDDSTRPISNLSRDIKRKAHAILRVGAHFNSPRYRAGAIDLYRLLQGALTFETRGIYSVLRISQNSRSVELETAIGDMHIDENQSGLIFYVPLDKDQQDVCFLDKMPNKLADWLMRDPTTQIPDPIEELMVMTLVMVINANASTVSSILARRGIIDLPIANTDVSGEEEEASASDDEGTDRSVRVLTPIGTTSELFSDAEDDGRGTQGSRRSQSLSNQGVVDVVHTVSRHGRLTSNQVARPQSGHPFVLLPQSPAPSSEDALYLRLLTRVVEAARRATFPSRGTFDMRDLANALPMEPWQGGFDGPDVESRFRSTTQLERDKKIGAAGELYVFELLSRLNPALSGWSRDNWQSTIRRYVTLHPDYEDLAPWYGRETADMTYQDEQGRFTSWLLDHGYLNEGWRNARPKYYLEVKTTTGSHDLAFYMSKSQYKRMQDLHNAPGHAEVYVILRVFGIENGNIGMRVYVDPEEMKLNQQLQFTGELWSVVPSPGSRVSGG